MNVGSVEVLLQLRDKLTAELQNPTRSLVQLSAQIRKNELAISKLTKETEKTGTAHAKAAFDIGKFSKQIATTLVHVSTAAVAYKLLGAAVKSITDQIEFVRTFEKIENITGLAREEVSKFRGELNALSTLTAKGPQELAEGLYSIASAGVRGKEATEILTAAAKASAVGLGETKDIAKSLTAAINAYGSENLTAARAADVLFAAVREGGAEANEVASVFGRVVGISAQLGVKFEEVGSFIATFTRLGVGADEAVTALRGTLTAMLTPTKAQEDALRAVGSSMAELRREVKERGLTAALIDLVKASKGNEDIIGAIIPNVRSLAGVLGVAGKQAEAYADVTDKVTNSTGDLNKAFTDVSQSASFQWDQLNAQFEQLGLTLGEMLVPAMISLRTALASIDPNTIKTFVDAAIPALTTLANALSVVIDLFKVLGPVISAIQVPTTMAFKALGNLLGFIHDSPLAKYLRDTGVAADDAAKRVAVFDLVASKALLAKVQAGGSATLTEYHQLQQAAKEAQAAVTALARERDSLNAGDKAAVAAKQRELNVAIANRDVINQTVAELEKTNRITREVGASVGAIPKLPSADAERFAQKIGEVNQQLSAQLESARAAFELAKATQARRIAGQEIDDETEISQQKRIQVEQTRIINQLQNAKRQLSDTEVARIKEMVAETIRLNDATKLVVGTTEALARMTKLAADFHQDVRKEIEKQNRAGELMADTVRSGFNFQKTALEHQLGLTKEILAAYTEGGDRAARAAVLQQEAIRNNTSLTRDQALALVDLQMEQDKLNYLVQTLGELAKPAWQIYYDAAFDAINAIGDSLTDVITQAAMEGKVNWESVWEGLKSSLIKIFAEMLADMLKRWIANQIAMRAASQAIGAGSTVGMGGGGGGNVGSLLSMFGGGGGAGGAGGMGGVSVGTMAGVAVAAFALYVVYKGFIEDHKRKFSGVTLGSQGEIISQAGHGKKYLDGLLKVVDQLVKGLQSFLKEAGIAMKSFASVTVEADKSGFSVFSGQSIIGHFKTAEEAISAAQAFMIRFGEFADDVPHLVRAAVESVSMIDQLNMENISSSIAFARELLTQNLPEIASQMEQFTTKFVDQMRRSFEMFAKDPAALLEATGSAITFFTTNLQSLYNQLTGHKEDPKEAAERQRVAYNAQRAIMIAQIQLLYNEIEARIDLMRTQIANVQMLRDLGIPGGGGSGIPGGGGSGGGGGGSVNPGVGSTGSGDWGGAHFPFKGGGALVVDDRNPTGNPQLQALLQILDNLARAMQGLPPEIGPGGVRTGRGGGGGRAGARQGVMDFMDEQRFALAQAKRNPLQQEIESIRRSFAEQLEAAGKNVALRNQLLALEKEAIDAARERYQAEVEARVDEATGVGNAFTEIRKKFSGLRKEVTDAGFAADKASDMMGRLAKAEEDAVNVLSQQMAGDLLGGLAQYIEDETVRAEFLKQQAIIKFNLDMAAYKAQFAILQAEGKLAPEVLKGIQDAFDWIEQHPPTFGTGGGGGGGNDNVPPFPGQYMGQTIAWGGTYWIWQGTYWESFGGTTPPSPGGGGGGTDTSQIDRARELLRRYQREGMNAWDRALLELNEDFDAIRAALGDTPEVMEAYADALARLREEFLEGLHDFYDELQGGALGGATVAQQFETAAARYQQILAAVQAGDLSQADALQQAAREYIDLAAQMFGTSTGGFATVRDQILAQLAALLGIGGDVTTGGIALVPGNVLGGADRFTAAMDTSMRATVAATQNVASVIDITSRMEQSKLDEVIGRLDTIIAAVLPDPAIAAAAISVGDEPERGVMFRRKKPA